MSGNIGLNNNFSTTNAASLNSNATASPPNLEKTMSNAFDWNQVFENVTASGSVTPSVINEIKTGIVAFQNYVKDPTNGSNNVQELSSQSQAILEKANDLLQQFPNTNESQAVSTASKSVTGALNELSSNGMSPSVAQTVLALASTGLQQLESYNNENSFGNY